MEGARKLPALAGRVIALILMRMQIYFTLQIFRDGQMYHEGYYTTSGKQISECWGNNIRYTKKYIYEFEPGYRVKIRCRGVPKEGWSDTYHYDFICEECFDSERLFNEDAFKRFAQITSRNGFMRWHMFPAEYHQVLKDGFEFMGWRTSTFKRWDGEPLPLPLSE